MSQIAYRANLGSGYFPFLSKLMGQSVIVGQKDQAFKNNVIDAGGTDDDDDKGFPQVFYAHNVAPIKQGYRSIGFQQRLPGLPGVDTFSDIFILRDSSENKFLYSPATTGQHRVFDGAIGSWQTATTIGIAANKYITVAYINGRSLIFFPSIGCFEYNSTTKVFDVVTLTGVTASALLGICASNGFLIAWDSFTVYRSQVTDILNFTTDFSLGSGSSIPQDIGGEIISCLPIAAGFIIYTTKNAVGASFSQNVRYPFIYAEVKGSSGIQSPSHVAWFNNTGIHYAWTQAGFQQVDKSSAKILFPDLTDFIISRVFEDYNSATDEFVTAKLTTNLLIRLAAVGKRFLILSYGINNFTHALFYDLSLKRWGKIRRTHVAVFELYLPNMFGQVTWEMIDPLTWQDLGNTTWADFATQVDTFEQPKETFALLLADGTVETVNFDDVHTDDDSVLILGKFQYIRERLITLQEIDIECVDQDYTNFDVKLLSSMDGTNIDYVTSPYLKINRGLYRQLNSMVIAKNHALVMKGTFSPTSLEMRITLEGKPTN